MCPVRPLERRLVTPGVNRHNVALNLFSASPEWSVIVCNKLNLMAVTGKYKID